MMSRNAERDRINGAIAGSGLASARLSGMKLRAHFHPPRPALGHMPFPDHRTCAGWEQLPSGEICDRQMTSAERKRDAARGSRKLRDAIRRTAR